MPNATVRANARTLPYVGQRLRKRMADAIDRLIAAMDALDEPSMDREDGHDAEEEFDEPWLGATEALDQRLAWRDGGATLDGEATETVDDILVFLTHAGREANQRGVAAARASIRIITRRCYPSNMEITQ